jgi:prolyl-tRNA synthetase
MVASIPDGTGTKERFVFAVVRGDMEVNDTKLANALKAKELRPALEEEIWSVGAVPGYASPRGLKDALIVVDDLIPKSPNLVAGANEEGYHLRNVNYGRDFEADIVTDLTTAEEGYACLECGNPLRAVRGVEIGNIFKLGTRYSESMGCYFQDKDGDSKPVIMGSYGIGSGRLLACIAEEYHDEYGLIWPISVAPYHVHLVLLPGKASQKSEDGDEPLQVAEELYENLQSNGFEVLFDDREESPGVKFNDADLIGIPIRLTVSSRSLKNDGVEFKRRDRAEKTIIPLDDLISKVNLEIKSLEAGIAEKIVDVPFDK